MGPGTWSNMRLALTVKDPPAKRVALYARSLGFAGLRVLFRGRNAFHEGTCGLHVGLRESCLPFLRPTLINPFNSSSHSQRWVGVFSPLYG